MIGDQDLWNIICSHHNLRQAWNKVKSNKGGPGIDHVTIDDFNQNLDENLTTLCDQLENDDYTPLPVQRVYIGKDDGTRRSIGISAVRDRVVQESLHLVLSPIFDDGFSDCSFAYRPGRSCLDALGRIEALINNGLTWVLDGDIKSFFDSIDHDLLMGFVAERVSDKRILKLIRDLIKVDIFENMSLHYEDPGISQGSVISPLLANLYLNRFDREIVAKGYHLIRYADDFIVLEESQEMVAKALVDITDVLSSLKLNLNEKKTRLIQAGKGFVFLGYYIDLNGKGPSKKAIAVISQRLHETVETGKRRDIGERIDELKQAIRGWSVYFHTCRGIEPGNALVLVALIETSLELGDEENAIKLLVLQKNYSIDQPDILYRIGHLAQKLGLREEALNAFSHTLSVDPDHVRARESLKKLELVDEDIYSSIVRLKKFIHHCPDLPRPYHDLAFCYTELGEYGQAQESYQKALELEVEMNTGPVEKTIVAPPLPVESQKLDFSDVDVSFFSSIFRGRTDVFASQWVDGEGRRGFTHVSGPLNHNEIKQHLAGEQTLGLYLMDEQDRVNLSVIDIDINQKALLEYASDEKELQKLHSLAEQDTLGVASVCDDLQIPYLIEDSGYKGRHIWFFFSTPLPAKLARTFLKFIIEKAGKPCSGIHREVFPNCDKVKGEGCGPLIKLPLGIHKRTNRRCFFLDQNKDGSLLPDQMAALSGIKHISLEKIEEILLTRVAKSATVQSNGKMSPMIESLLSSCTVIGRLVKKAEDTHYLDNSERVTLLYTFGHLGQEGNDFLHKVISNCINYDYDFTEKKIRKIKPYPISCARIKEKHEDIALELGCNCHFKIPREGYPSPVLHAFKIKYGPKKWIPQPPQTNNGMVKKNGEVPDDINMKLKTYIELKKHLNGINRSIHRTEEEMASFFDNAGTDSLSTKYGLLVRRKKAGDKIEWIIML